MRSLTGCCHGFREGRLAQEKTEVGLMAGNMPGNADDAIIVQPCKRCPHRDGPLVNGVLTAPAGVSATCCRSRFSGHKENNVLTNGGVSYGRHPAAISALIKLIRGASTVGRRLKLPLFGGHPTRVGRSLQMAEN